MRNAVIATGTVAGLLALATTAQAQEGRHIDISAQVRVMHDTNFARSSDAAADLRGVDPSETVISPAITANILLPISRQSVYLRGSIGRDYYQNNDFLNSARYDINAGLIYNVAICDGSVNASFSEAQSDLRDLTLLVTKNISTQKSIGFDALCGRTTGFAPSVRVNSTSTDNSAAALTQADSDQLSGEIGLAYRRPTFGVLTLFAAHDDTDYDERLLAVGPQLIKDGFESDSIGVRYERRLGRLGGQLAVSYIHTKPNSPLVEDFTGLTYSGLINFKVSTRISASLNLSRSTDPTIRPGAAYTVSTLTQLTGTYAIGSRIKVTAGLDVGQNEFKGAFQPPGSLTSENFNAIYGAVNWDIGRRVTLAFDLRHEVRDANVAGFDYSSTQVGVTAIGRF